MDAFKLITQQINGGCFEMFPVLPSFNHFPTFLNRMRHYFYDEGFTSNVVLTIVFLMKTELGETTEHAIKLVDGEKHMDELTFAFYDLCMTHNFCLHNTQARLVKIIQENIEDYCIRRFNEATNIV